MHCLTPKQYLRIRKSLMRLCRACIPQLVTRSLIWICLSAFKSVNLRLLRLPNRHNCTAQTALFGASCWSQHLNEEQILELDLFKQKVSLQHNYGTGHIERWHTGAHTHTRAHTQMHTHTHTRTHVHTHIHIYTHAHLQGALVQAGPWAILAVLQGPLHPHPHL